MYYNENKPTGQQGVYEGQYPQFAQGGTSHGSSSSSGSSRSNYFPFWGNYPLMYLSRFGHYKPFELHAVEEVCYLLRDAKEKLKSGDQSKTAFQDLYEAYERLKNLLEEAEKHGALK